jgi:hypothetical protein
LSLSNPTFKSYSSAFFVFDKGAAPAAFASVQFLNFTRAKVLLGDGDEVGVTSAVEAEGSALGAAFTGTITPLFHINLELALIQVNFLPPTI